MSIAALIRNMAAAGATPEAIAIAVEAIEGAHAQVEARRANDRERKRRQRDASRDIHVTVTGQSADIPQDTPSPDKDPHTPKINPNPAHTTRTRKGTRLETNWALPDDWREWAETERNWDRDAVTAEAAAFADYWHAKPGKDGVKLDWLATWRNWVRNSRRANGTGPKVADTGKWTAERRAAYARALDSPDDAASRAMKVRSIGELARQIGGQT